MSKYIVSRYSSLDETFIQDTVEADSSLTAALLALNWDAVPSAASLSKLQATLARVGINLEVSRVG